MDTLGCAASAARAPRLSPRVLSGPTAVICAIAKQALRLEPLHVMNQELHTIAASGDGQTLTVPANDRRYWVVYPTLRACMA